MGEREERKNGTPTHVIVLCLLNHSSYRDDWRYFHSTPQSRIRTCVDVALNVPHLIA